METNMSGHVNISVAMLKKLIAGELKKTCNQTNFNNPSFVGVEYDAKAVDAINLIARGLISNAESLGKLAEVLQASNVTIEAMIKVEK
jgi:hypothetical protein